MYTLPFLSVQIIQINLVLKNVGSVYISLTSGSNNTNKLSPQELHNHLYKRW